MSRLDHSELSVQINLEAANLHRHWITPDRCEACLYMLKKACDPSLDLANWMSASSDHKCSVSVQQTFEILKILVCQGFF